MDLLALKDVYLKPNKKKSIAHLSSKLVKMFNEAPTQIHKTYIYLAEQ